MKSTITTIALCLAFTIANAQDVKESEVPANVKESFSKKYPGLKVGEWEKKGADYVAEFQLNKVEASAVFEANGNFKEVEQEIKLYELPNSAIDYCTKNFKGYKISETSKITDASDKVIFEAEMENGKEHFDVIFDDKGNFVKKGDVKTGKKDKD